MYVVSRRNRREPMRRQAHAVQWRPPRAPQVFTLHPLLHPLALTDRHHRSRAHRQVSVWYHPPLQPLATSININVRIRVVLPPQGTGRRMAFPDVLTPYVSTSINIHTASLTRVPPLVRERVARRPIRFAPPVLPATFNQQILRMRQAPPMLRAKVVRTPLVVRPPWSPQTFALQTVFLTRPLEITRHRTRARRRSTPTIITGMIWHTGLKRLGVPRRMRVRVGL